MRQRWMKSAWVLMLLVGFLFSGCSAGIVGAGTTTSGGTTGGTTDPSSIPSISGVVRYVSSTCSGLTVAPAQQCATVAAVDDASYSITWGNVHSGLLNVSGQTVSMDSPTFTLGPSDTASFESAVLSWTDELLAKEAVEDGDQVTFALAEGDASCSLVMEVDSDCSDVLSIRPAITMRANLSSVFSGLLGSTAVMPSVSDSDIDDTHDICLDIEDDMTWVEGDDGSLELRVVYEMSQPLSYTSTLTLTTVLYFDARNHELSRMDDLNVYVDDESFELSCTPQEGALTGLADETITVACSGTINMGEGDVEVSGNLVWKQEAYGCDEAYPTPEEYFEEEQYGRLSGPFPAEWGDTEKLHYFSDYGVYDEDNMYYEEWGDEEFENGPPFCIALDQPEALRGVSINGMTYDTIPEYISLVVRENDVCFYDEDGEKVFEDPCLPYMAEPGIVPMYNLTSTLSGSFNGVSGQNTCIATINGGKSTLLTIRCDNTAEVEDPLDYTAADNCQLFFKRGYERDDL